MLNREKRGKLSREILGIFGVSVIGAVLFFFLITWAAGALTMAYYQRNHLILDEMFLLELNFWVNNLSLLAAVVLFVTLFLCLVGQKVAYVREITRGIEALRAHQMDYEIPLTGNNELTELAVCVNDLARTETELRQREDALRRERERLIRDLSHDIRTPLTAILSYSEYLRGRDELTQQERNAYLQLIEGKAEQMKDLTDQLLDSSVTKVETIEDGRLLMEQLAYEWEAQLEERFVCRLDFVGCPAFSGEFDVREFRRIFDNLASNVEKYADPAQEVRLCVRSQDGRLVMEQRNACLEAIGAGTESYGIGLDSIRRIVERSGGGIQVERSATHFNIKITWMKIG